MVANGYLMGVPALTLDKKNNKYVIGESGGNYAFFNIKKKQFYYIDYFMSRYSTAGYGPGYSEVKQSEYDF